MTKEQFIYGLTACGCLLKDGKTWYEHNELIKCFEDLGLLEQEPKTGHWIEGGFDFDYWVCSECKYQPNNDYYRPSYNYCPNCGCRMKGESEEV